VQDAIAWQSKSGLRINRQLLAEEFSKLPTLDYTANPKRFQCLLLYGHGEVDLPLAQEIKRSDGQRPCSMFPRVRSLLLPLVLAYRYPPGASWEYRSPGAEKQSHAEKP
jgi:hypothetical protein